MIWSYHRLITVAKAMTSSVPSPEAATSLKSKGRTLNESRPVRKTSRKGSWVDTRTELEPSIMCLVGPVRVKMRAMITIAAMLTCHKMSCLVRMATVLMEEAWHTRTASVVHRMSGPVDSIADRAQLRSSWPRSKAQVAMGSEASIVCTMEAHDLTSMLENTSVRCPWITTCAPTSKRTKWHRPSCAWMRPLTRLWTTLAVWARLVAALAPMTIITSMSAHCHLPVCSISMRLKGWSRINIEMARMEAATGTNIRTTVCPTIRIAMLCMQVQLLRGR